MVPFCRIVFQIKYWISVIMQSRKGIVKDMGSFCNWTIKYWCILWQKYCCIIICKMKKTNYRMCFFFLILTFNVELINTFWRIVQGLKGVHFLMWLVDLSFVSGPVCQCLFQSQMSTRLINILRCLWCCINVEPRIMFTQLVWRLSLAISSHPLIELFHWLIYTANKSYISCLCCFIVVWKMAWILFMKSDMLLTVTHWLHGSLSPLIKMNFFTWYKWFTFVLEPKS
jgi:hypothetical protein